MATVKIKQLPPDINYVKNKFVCLTLFKFIVCKTDKTLTFFNCRDFDKIFNTS